MQAVRASRLCWMSDAPLGYGSTPVNAATYGRLR